MVRTLLLLALGLAGASAKTTKTVQIEITTEVSDDGPCCEGECTGTASWGTYNKYFSIADDSGPWLCGETCIRDEFYPVFHLFEKNLTLAADDSVCKDAGYTKYNSTVTHGGGGLYCTLDLYECTRSGGCPHPSDLL